MLRIIAMLADVIFLVFIALAIDYDHLPKDEYWRIALITLIPIINISALYSQGKSGFIQKLSDTVTLSLDARNSELRKKIKDNREEDAS